MAKRLIITDVDGVILDWMEHFKTYMIEQGYSPLKDKPARFDCTDWFNLPYPELHKLMMASNETSNFGDIVPIKDSIKFMKLLKNDYDFIALSSCGADNKQLRIENLHNLFGQDFFLDIHCIDPHHSKCSYLKQYEPSYWIEDNIKNAELGVQFGHIPFVLNADYNLMESEKPLIRIDSWKQIYGILTQQFKMCDVI